MEKNIEARNEALQTATKAPSLKVVVAMVGVAILIFVLISSYQIFKSIDSKASLNDVEKIYFPVLIKTDATVAILDKIGDEYIKAVMTAQSDKTAAAHKQGAEAVQFIEEIAKTFPGDNSQINRIREQVYKYNEEAAKMNDDYLHQRTVLNLWSPRMKEMNSELAATRALLMDFRARCFSEFTQTLAETRSGLAWNLYLSLSLGLMNICFMGVLVYLIRNNLQMMSHIAEQNATLERRVDERTAQLNQKTQDINAMLQNMKLGVCTVTPGNKIHPEFSAHMHVIFEADALADKEVLDALFTRAEIGDDAKDQISTSLAAMVGEDEMMFDCNAHLLPHEVHAHGNEGSDKVLQMDWSPIVSEAGIVEKVLLIVQDITHFRELELASAKQREELDIISQIIKISIGKFNDFISSAKSFITENQGLVVGTSDKNPQTIAALFRNMHTVKGNARTYQLTLITDAAHAAEQEYDRLRSDPDSVWDPAKLLAGLQAVEAAIERYVDANENKLGRKGRASDMLTSRGAFVSNNAISDLKNMADKLDPNNAIQVEQIRAAIAQLGLVPFERLASGSIDSLSSLAKELGKPEPRFEITNGDVAFNNIFAEALKGSLMHIVRNCMDHGIEMPDVRAKAGKPAQGLVRFDCTPQQGGSIVLRIRDDGRGLAMTKLYEKGVAAGVFPQGSSPTPHQVAELIFHAGLSTAEQVTQVSGRGVGMDAVRAFLGEQGAEIAIVLDHPNESLEFSPFEFVIKVPASATQVV